MSDPYDGGSPLVRNILIATFVVWVIGSVIFMYMANNRINDMEQRQTAGLNELSKKMEDSNGQMRDSINVIADRVGLTQKDLTRLKSDEQSTKQKFTAVNGAVDGVKGDLSKVSADVTDTKTDLAATKGRLETAIGDINRHSELIATNHDQLEELRHRGDRDYLEFTLQKGKGPIRLSTISLQLKKIDAKKGEFTLMVLADDKKIEKKNKNLNEPLQFYSGRSRSLFEVVINAADKDLVSGYLSIPKNMAANVPADSRSQTQQQ